jgi:hypothetical protein
MGPDYRTYDPKGWGGDPKRGAALGRPSVKDAANDEPIKLYLRRVHLNSGGYDRNGTYFGHGSGLWWVASEDETVDYMLRASDRDDAKSLVLAEYPNARFFR